MEGRPPRRPPYAGPIPFGGRRRGRPSTNQLSERDLIYFSHRSTSGRKSNAARSLALAATPFHPSVPWPKLTFLADQISLRPDVSRALRSTIAFMVPLL